MRRIRIQRRTVRGEIRYVVDLREFKDGKQVGKRSFFETKADAERFVESAQMDLDSGGPVAMAPQEKADYYHANHKRQRLVPVPTWTQLVDSWERQYGFNPTTTREAIGEILSAKRKAGLRESYIRKLEGHLQILEDEPEKKVSAYTRHDIEKILNRPDWGLWAKRAAKIDFATFFNFCIKRGWCGKNPCSELEEIILDECARDILTPEQAKAFLSAQADKRLMRYFIDQLFGGMREEEARLLEQGQEHELHIELPRTKTRSPRFIEWNDTWRLWRKAYPGDYFPIGNWKRRVDKARRIGEAAIIKAKLAPKGFKLPKNCLRHSFCSYAAKLWGAGRAAELAGHSESIQKKHYRRPIPLEQAQTFFHLHP